MKVFDGPSAIAQCCDERKMRTRRRFLFYTYYSLTPDTGHLYSRREDRSLARAFLIRHTSRDVSVYGRLELCPQMQLVADGPAIL